MLLPMLYGAGREAHGEILAQAAQMAEQNQLRPLIDRETFGFRDVGSAHAKLEQGNAFGKIVLTPDF
jgi:NADPH2:quinone reductase